ncbi:MAG: T9SS type A sorting domain-containing protein, partial [Bacteroidota bacterium]
PNLRDDDYSSMLDMKFDFRYYWIDYDQIRVGTNGWLSFNNTSRENNWCFQQMPNALSAHTNNTLAPFIADLNHETIYPSFPNPAEVWYWTNETDSCVISFIDVPWWKDDSSGLSAPNYEGSNTFQVILSAQDSSITFQYLSMSRDDFNNLVDCGSEIVVGIENSTGQIGLQPYLEAVPPDSYAIKFVPPTQDTFEVRDAAAIWNLNAENRGKIVVVGDSLELNTVVDNVGNVTLDSMVEVRARVTRPGGNLVWSETDTLDSMAAAVPIPIQWDTKAVLTLPGQHFYNVTTISQEDVNATNNSQSVELAAVVDTGQFVTLTYSISNTTNQSLSWPPGIGGNNGGGAYMNLPRWPYKIHSVDVFVLGNDGDPNTPLPAGFRVELHADDSAGPPGTLLASELITSGQGLEDAWNNIEFADKPTISSGGFYVSWIQGGPGVGLGTEIAGPKSRQTYEILNGIWGNYRFSNDQDFLLKVNVELNPVNIEDPKAAPTPTLDLFPNPSNGLVTANIRTRVAGPVEIEVHDLYGRSMQKMAPKKWSPGLHQLHFDLAFAPAGVYFVQIKQGNQVVTKKLILNH